jgi:glycosyltransferase involved in cell wall biosynthesis
MGYGRSKLISVIIPVYNGVNFLRESIDSVLNQTFEDYELIVVDDGSTDATPAIAQAYENRVTYFRKDNGGVSTALNLGISQAQGKYIAWLSHDDLFLPTKLERQLELLRHNPQFKACYTDFYIIDTTGTIIQTMETPWNPRDRALRVLFGGMYINGSSMLIERACFDKVGLFRSQYRYTQDADMWLRMLKYFEIGRSPEKLLKWRSHPEQDSRKEQALEAEKQVMYRTAFAELGIATIFPEFAQSAHDPQVIAWSHQWFGDTMAKHRFWFDFADEEYRRSVSQWPSWRNLSHLKLALGSRRFFAPQRLYRRVRRACGKALRAAGLRKPPGD